MKSSLKFDSTNDEALLERLRAWESEVRNLAERANPGIADRLKYRSTVPLDLLPLGARRSYMAKYKELIQFSPTLERLAGGRIPEGGEIGASKIASRLRLQGDRGKQFARLPVEADDSILSYLYSQMNIQHRPLRRDIGTAFQHFTIGSTNIPSVDMIQNGMAAIKRMRSGEAIMEHGSKYTLFDLETAGLDFGKIRELSYRSGIVGSDKVADNTVHFRVAAFNRGMLADKGSPISVEDWMRRKMGVRYASESMGDGDEFIKHFMPFLKQVQESKYVVGHNISKFDIQQVFVGLSGTSAYKRNMDMGDGIKFREYVDNIFENLNGKIIDTLELAKAAPNLSKIQTAAEIAARGGHQTFSIENLLLETNLLEKAPHLKAMINDAGLHSGSVDSAVTDALLRHLPELRVQKARIGVEMRRSISTAAAITPFTKIRDQAQISDDLLRHMIISGEGIKTDDPKFQARLEKIAANPEASKGELKRVISEIRKGTKPLKFEITPVLQEVFHTRDLKMGSIAATEHTALPMIGRFDRFTGRNTPYRGRSRRDFGMMGRHADQAPSVSEFRAFQRQLSSAGVPYAGLSFEERKIGHALSSITAGLEHGIPGKAAVFGADSLISRFESFSPTSVKYSSEFTDRLTVPMSILQSMKDSAFANPLAGESPIMLGFSPFEYVPEHGDDLTRRYGINLFYKFKDQGEATGLSAHIESLAKGTNEEIARALGISLDDPKLVQAIDRFKSSAPDLIKRLKDPSVLERGIAVGQIHRDQSMARRVFDVFTQFNDNIRAGEDVLGLAVPLVDTRDSLIRVGAPVFNSMLGEEGLRDLGSLTGQAVSYLDNTMMGIASNRSMNASAQLILRSGASDEGVKRILRGADLFAELKPKLGKGTAVTAAAGIGYYIYRKHKQRSAYEEPLRPMPYETGSNYSLKDQVDLAMMNGKNSGRFIDPLATASLVDTLNQNKINHGSMAWDRNSSLYGGVL